MMSNPPPLITILGPTASGKSALALSLAKEFDGYIISADSRQVYRSMDIGTAKPSTDERQTVPHFLLDVVNPDESFSVADYQHKVMEILKNEKGLPFLVGGTGLYIDAILENWEIPKGTTDWQEREKLEQQPFHLLVKRLQDVDPESAAVIDLNNKRRVIRALEVAEQTGESFVAQKKKRPLPYRVLKIGLSVPREELIKRIDRRVDEMMERGLLDESQTLGKKYGWDSPAMSGLGYRQLGQHLRGETTLNEAVDRIKIETRQYAKRQMTWFKRDETISWITTKSGAEALIRNMVE